MNASSAWLSTLQFGLADSRSRLLPSALTKSSFFSPASCCRQQTRNASLLRRPLRPYTFTQLVTLSDGSAFLQRTTSPIPVLASLKDSKNAALWNPSNRKLAFMEDDVAGRLRLFRSRFGHSWDATPEGEEKSEDNITDLTNTFTEEASPAAGSADGQKAKKKV